MTALLAARRAEHTRRHTAKMRLALDAEKMRRGCAHCGYKEHLYALQWDHILPRKSGKKWVGPKCMAEARRLMEDPNIQVLCANCHCIKTRTVGDNMALSPFLKVGTP